MGEIIYTKGTPADRADIVDFANYVFSQNSVPHDFKTLLPKVYADNVVGMEDWHYLVKKDGRIRAMVANYPMKMRVLDATLQCGMVGTVSVHPYSRREGYMKGLMAEMISDARGKCDLLALGGQRQRYNYFGFEDMGVALNYEINLTGLRHHLGNEDVSDITFSEITEDHPEEIHFVQDLMAKRPVLGERPEDRLIAILHSWRQRARLIRIGGRMAGYVIGAVSELELTDEAQLPRVMKALLIEDGIRETELAVAPWEKERIRILEPMYESRSIGAMEMVDILCWTNVIGAFLKLKASYSRLEDGVCTLCVAGEETFTMRVEDGKADVRQDDRAPDLTLNHLSAERKLFGLEGLLSEDAAIPKSWLPLPFFITNVDTF